MKLREFMPVLLLSNLNSSIFKNLTRFKIMNDKKFLLSIKPVIIIFWINF